MNNQSGSLTISTELDPGPTFPFCKPSDVLLTIGQDSEPVVSIMADATVVIHKEGGDKEAAKMFYETLEFEGKTLLARIQYLEDRLERNRGEG